ncbi:MAG: endonuclease/exonuclease/phosphatase family protein [Flavobacteriales bacterium]
MAYSVLCWNIEHFKTNTSRTKVVADRIKTHNPDVFTILETESLNTLEMMRQHFPSYNFHITDGKQSQEIMVAVRNGKFTQTAFTQKREFDNGNPFLRPGALLTLSHNSQLYNLLFLHNDSGPDASAFGNRFEMIDKVSNMAKAIHKKKPDARVIVAGDLNTMGMGFPSQRKSDKRVTMQEEIAGVASLMADYNFSWASKQHDATWLSKPGGYDSNLDHVICSQTVVLKELGQRTDGSNYHIKVEGWVGLTLAQQKTYMEKYSDHCLLYWEVQ